MNSAHPEVFSLAQFLVAWTCRRCETGFPGLTIGWCVCVADGGNGRVTGHECLRCRCKTPGGNVGDRGEHVRFIEDGRIEVFHYFDDHHALVPPERATEFTVETLDPTGRLLRTTTYRADRSASPEQSGCAGGGHEEERG